MARRAERATSFAGTIRRQQRFLCRLKKLAIFFERFFRWAGGTAKDAGGFYPNVKNPFILGIFFNQHVVIVVPLSAIFNHLAHPSLFSTLTKILRTCPNTRSTNAAVCNGSSKICPHPSDDIRSSFPLNDLSVQKTVLAHPIKINTNFLKKIEGSCPPILLISSLPIFQRILKRHLQEPRPSPSA